MSHAYMELCVSKHLFCFVYNVQVGKTLSERRWKAAFTNDGHIEIGGVLRRIQRGVDYIF